MIIHLYGADSYRRLQNLKVIIREYEEKHSALTMEKFYIDDDAPASEEWDKLKEFVFSKSLFGEKKLAVIHGSVPAEFLQELEADKEVIILISSEKKLFNGKCLSYEFTPLSGREFAKFLLREAKKRNLKLNPKLLNQLVQVYDGDSWGAVNELEKMSLSGCLRLSAPDLLAFHDSSLFKLIYQLQSRDLKDKLTALTLLLNNEDAAKVFNLTAYSLGKKRQFADYDVLIKSGKLGYEEALLDSVLG